MSMQLTSTSWFDNYFSSGKYDEMFTPQMGIKPPWESLFSAFKELGAEGLKARQKDMDWLLSENGVTYNVYNDPKGMNRPWDLNLVPFVIRENEWRIVSEGLRQRARLIDLILKDVYGPCRLVYEGIVPHEVIFGHRGFLRQCSGIEYNTEKMLSIYAADLSRGTDGRIWVVNDRTEAPSGWGYSLENRATTRRVLPELYAKMNIRSLSGFFQDMEQMLIQASPKPKEYPNIVILTPGSLNETYFEHAYLASFFGYPLVHGNDLVVRDGYLWMKSLKGLKPIDVVLRRVDDAYVDPLELREDSHLGVAGLLNVIRRKNVSVINPIGSGVMENPGLIPFMPSIAKYFLNEELLLPQIASWWCGQEKEKGYVLENLHQLVVKRIDRTNRESIHFGESMTRTELDTLKREINARPYRFVAQERIHFSTAPNLHGAAFEPRNMVARAFTIASNDDYQVMPGGLVRVAADRDAVRVSNQRGGTSKDFWVVGEEPADTVMVPYDGQRKEMEASGLDDLPSLTAENLFWAGRYVGRTLMTARLLRTTLRQMGLVENLNERPNTTKLEVLYRAVSHLTGTLPGFVGPNKNGSSAMDDPYAEILSVLTDGNRAGSLAHTLHMFDNSYYAIRHLWSSDMWRVFRNIQKVWRNFVQNEDRSINFCIKMLDQLITRLIAFMGLVEESIMVHQGLLLYFLGLQLELSLLTVNKCRALLSNKYEDQVEYELLQYLLASHESQNIYRYTFRSHFRLDHVLELLVFDRHYPRSLAFMLKRLQKDVAKLPRSKTGPKMNGIQKSVFEAYSKVQLADTYALMRTPSEDVAVRTELDRFFESLTDLLFQTSQGISDLYFSHAKKQSQLVDSSFPV